MKIFISADIEGTCGIVNVDETNINSEFCMYHRIQMTKEVKAACDGATAAGCNYILVKDAHASARNIIPDMLPTDANIMRGWTGDPLSMMSGLDSSFDACIFIGYHSGATVSGNPLSHTKNGRAYDYIKINDELANEFVINSYTASYYNVPVIFISGDEMLCSDSKKLNKNIHTVSVSKGIGAATIAIHPELAIKTIESEVKKALSCDLSKCIVKLPDSFKLEIRYKNHKDAYRTSFYPNVILKDSQTISFKTNDYFEVLRMLLFSI